MEVRLNRLELLEELVPMQGIVERRTTIPVLSHLLLRAQGDRLEVAATDLEVSLTSWSPAEVREEGAIALRARKLLEIVRASAGGELTLRIDESGMLTLLAGRSKFKIHGLPAEDFPSLPSIDGEAALEIPFASFRAMIAKVFFAISSEESRFQLSGALLEPKDGRLVLVATDGHRLALIETGVEGLAAGDSVLVPRKALQELQRFEDEGDIRLHRGENHLAFHVGRRRLICRILEGTFPDYDRVISTDNDKELVGDREELSEAIHRVGLLAADRSRAVRLLLRPDTVVVSAANPDLGEATEEVPCEYKGTEMSLAVNPDYLRDFLAASGTERVRFELKDDNSQCVGHPVDGADERYLCVIMPIRL